MEQHLKYEGLLHTLERIPPEEDFAQPAANETADQETARKAKLEKRLKEDDAAVNEFWMALDDDAMGQVFQCQYAKEIMDRLVELYQSHGTTAMLGVRARLYTLRMENFASLKELFALHSELIRQLGSMEEAVPHKEVVDTLLEAIPDKFKHVLGALSVIRKEE